MGPTHTLIQAALPNREDKRRIARALGYNDESTMYKWCEDPEGSGRPNPLDYLEVILDHALIHHPDAALAIVQRLEAKVVRSLSARAQCLPMAELLIVLQPGCEKESIEAVRAFSGAMRQSLLSGECDAAVLLREVEEVEREMNKAAVMLRAVIEAEQRTEVRG